MTTTSGPRATPPQRTGVCTQCHKPAACGSGHMAHPNATDLGRNGESFIEAQLGLELLSLSRIRDGSDMRT